MKKLSPIFFFILLSCAVVLGENWHVETLPVESIKAGMIGTARTVFYGDKIEEFQVQIIDVMHDFYPGRDVILARLLGEQAEKNGVVSGMSGSPVYIDGRLIGAIAYSFGQFMKEPVAGITPISAMLDILDRENARPGGSAIRMGTANEYLRAVHTGVNDDFWRRVLRLPQNESSHGAVLQRIATPLVFRGFQAEVVGQYSEIFASMGFSPAYAGGGEESASPSFEPGSAVSIVLVSGDYSIEATGTVTAVSENRLLAFGHQVFNFGPIRLPLAGSRIYATLPSLMASSKMSTATKIVGTFVQDRMSGALGDLTVQPTMIPVSLHLESPLHPPASFSFKMADDPAFNNLLPFYLRIALIQAMNAARLAGELNSSRLSGAITLADGRHVELDDFFTSRQQFGFMVAGADANAAADLVTTLLGALLVNDFNAPPVVRVDLKLVTIPDAHYTMIESVWQDKTVVKPGDDLTLTVRLRDNEEKIAKVMQRVHIPENISGNRLSILVSSGASLSRYEMQVNRDAFVPKSFDHLLRIVEKRRKSQNLYIQVRALDSGLIVEGEKMSDLPPSILGVMNTRSSGGVSKQMRDRVLFEAELPMDQAIIGAKRMTLKIDQPAKATNNNNEGRKAWFY